MLQEKREVRDFWDGHPLGGSWDTFKSQMDWKHKREPWLNEIINEKRFRDKYILEVGCGPGIDLGLIYLKGARCVGLDISSESLHKCKENFRELGISVDLVIGDSEFLPFKDDKFDVVFSYGVLHHTPSIEKGVVQIYRVLKNGGNGIIMLYRKYAPQQIIISILRGINKWFSIEKFFKKRYDVDTTLNPKFGTAFEELFSCPIIQFTSKRGVKKIFKKINILKMELYQTGFRRLAVDFFKDASRLTSFFIALDKGTEKVFGFYRFIYFEKT